jgi:hypothetical protein
MAEHFDVEFSQLFTFANVPIKVPQLSRAVAEL